MFLCAAIIRKWLHKDVPIPLVVGVIVFPSADNCLIATFNLFIGLLMKFSCCQMFETYVSANICVDFV